MFQSITSKLDLQRFFIGEGPKQAPYLLTHRRVYILPTRQGLAFALLLFIMLLGSINYSNSLGYFLTFLLASLSVVTIFHTYNNLLKLSFGTATCPPAFSGDQAEIILKINNVNHHKRFSINAFTAEKIKTSSDIPENCYTHLPVKHRYLLRGYQALPRITIESRFPFGLFRAWSFIQLDQSQLVYPKPSNDVALPVKSAGLSEGNKQLNTGSDDFKGLRSYIEGDPLQHIHWKSYARHHTLQTKEFSSTASDELWLSWTDTTASGVEARLSQLTRWLLIAENSHLIYGLNIPSITVKPGSGQQHLDHCLKQLALYNLNEADQ